MVFFLLALWLGGWSYETDNFRVQGPLDLNYDHRSAQFRSDYRKIWYATHFWNFSTVVDKNSYRKHCANDQQTQDQLASVVHYSFGSL